MTLAIAPRRLPFLRDLATAAALSVALAAAGPAHAAAPRAEFEELVARADEHAEAGRHAEALRTYADALSAMPPDVAGGDVGEFVAMAAASSAIEGFRAQGDRTLLEDGRAVLLAFIDATRRAGKGAAPTAGAEERLADIDALMPAATADPEPTLDADRDTALATTDEPADAETERAAPDRRRLGIGLLAAGGVAAAAGVALVIAGVRQVRWYEAKLESGGWVPSDAGYGDQITRAEKIRNLDAGLGAAALAVGVGLGIGGAVLVVKSKRGARELALVPVIGRERALLSATLRF